VSYRIQSCVLEVTLIEAAEFRSQFTIMTCGLSS